MVARLAYAAGIAEDQPIDSKIKIINCAICNNSRTITFYPALTVGRNIIYLCDEQKLWNFSGTNRAMNNEKSAKIATEALSSPLLLPMQKCD